MATQTTDAESETGADLQESFEEMGSLMTDLSETMDSVADQIGTVESENLTTSAGAATTSFAAADD